MSDPLPVFRYHPDPLATGRVVASRATCRRCGRARGFICDGPVHAAQELDDALCPWCIADGSAARRFEAEFVNAAGIGGYGTWEAVPPAPARAPLSAAEREAADAGWRSEREQARAALAAHRAGRRP